MECTTYLLPVLLSTFVCFQSVTAIAQVRRGSSLATFTHFAPKNTYAVVGGDVVFHWDYQTKTANAVDVVMLKFGEHDALLKKYVESGVVYSNSDKKVAGIARRISVLRGRKATFKLSNVSMTDAGRYYCVLFVRDFTYVTSSTKLTVLPSFSVRLYGGARPNEGRVEIFQGVHWEALCGRGNFGLNDANVVCRMLGYQTGNAYHVVTTKYAGATGMVWPNKFNCKGTETNLLDCNIEEIGASQKSSCNSHRYMSDVGITCHVPQGQPLPTRTPAVNVPNIRVRLSGGSNSHSGFVQVFRDGKWGTICRDGWNVKAADVICRQLGFPGASSCCINERVRTRVPIVMSNIQCTGNERSLSECNHQEFGTKMWCIGRPNRVFVECKTDTSSRESFQVRLGKGGSVEINHNGEWGYICADRLRIEDLRTVCRQLGFPGLKKPLRLNLRAFRDNLPVMMNLRRYNFLSGCKEAMIRTGMLPTSINQCYHSTWGVQKRCRSRIVGVQCLPRKDIPNRCLRLVGGRGPYEGRVEVLMTNFWGAVCGTSWSFQNAQVICRQLGFPGAKTALVSTKVSGARSRIPYSVSALHCNGTESNLGQCYYETENRRSPCSTYHSDAAVECLRNTA